LQQALLVVQLLGEVFAACIVAKKAQHGTADLLIVEQGREFEVEPLKSCSPFPSLLSEAELATLMDDA
jgi:hypothetical protein